MTPPDFTKPAPEPAPYARFEAPDPDRRHRERRRNLLSLAGLAIVAALALAIVTGLAGREPAPEPTPVITAPAPVAARGPEVRLHDATVISAPPDPGSGLYFPDILTGCYGGVRVFLHSGDPNDMQVIADPSCTLPGGEVVAP